MAKPTLHRKLHAFFTVLGAAFPTRPNSMVSDAAVFEEAVMAGLALVLFVTLFAFGQQYFGWTDVSGWVQISLASSFIFGIICGFRVKG